MNTTMSLDETKHDPVMLDQVLSIISPQHGGNFIDCTFGGGGYSRAILKYPNTKVYAIDRDKITKKYADTLSKKYPKRFNFFQDKFSNLEKIIDPNIKPKAIIFDLGISSYQLADEQRGFSFFSKGTLNMEMGFNKHTALSVINNLEKKHLGNVIKVLGEEKHGRIIANKIFKQRNLKPIKNTEELVNIINQAKGNYNKFKKNPATKTFQAIRILVNQELTELILGLIAATQLLSENATIIVLSFHSLEDKIVKNFFKALANSNSNPSRYLPANSNKSYLFKKFSQKIITPTKKEIIKNIRSRSAKLRYGIRNDKSFFYPNNFKNKFNNYFKMEDIKI